MGRPRINDPLFEEIEERISNGETRSEAVAAVAAQHDKQPASLNSQFSTWRNRERAAVPRSTNPREDATTAIIRQLKSSWRREQDRFAAVQSARARLDAEERDILASIKKIEGLAKAAGLDSKDLSE